MDHNDIPVTRTEKGLAYDAYLRGLENMSRSSDPKVKDEWRAANEEVRRLKDSSYVSENPILRDLAVMYQNDQAIGVRCMPVYMTGKSPARYCIHDQRSQYGVHDDAVAKNGDANEISDTWTEDSVTLIDRTLHQLVAQTDVDDAAEPLKPLISATQHVLMRMDAAREARIASIVMTAANYGANTGAVGAGSKWNGATGGDPAGVVDAAVALCMPGGVGTRRIGVTSPAVWNVLKRHERFLDVHKGTGIPGDLLTAVASWLDLNEIVVGGMWYDTANEGQAAASYGRMWTNAFAVLCVASVPMPEIASFGYTFQDAATKAVQLFREEKGSRGGYLCKAGHREKSQVVGALTSYLITAPLG
jgi:hypothetical protein